MALAPSCRACGASGGEAFYEQRGVPCHAVQVHATRAAALAAPRGDIRLSLCRRCAFVQNDLFDESKLDLAGQHEESQAFSPHFQVFARELARSWIERHHLAGATVLEIGCGKGDFLRLMIEEGIGRGIGVDPGVRPERISGPEASRLEWIRERFSPALADRRPAAIVCRHTLEHVSEVRQFVGQVRAALEGRPEVPVLFELPDVTRILQEGAFWDVYFEHCSYFSAGALGRLFRQEGFEILDLRRVYGDQYLILEARAGSAAPHPLEEAPDALASAVRRFADETAAQLGRWRARLAEERRRGRRVVIWGAGSKGLSFLDAMGSGAGIDLAVDVNVHLQGRFVAGSGQRIVAPGELATYRPDLVIMMNPVYLAENGRTLASLGLSPEIVSV